MRVHSSFCFPYTPPSTPLSVWGPRSAFPDINPPSLPRWRETGEEVWGFNMLCANFLEIPLHASPLFSVGLCTFQVLRLFQDLGKSFHFSSV